MNLGMEELLCAEDCTPSDQMKRKRKRTRDASHKGEEKKNDLSDKTSPVLDSGGAHEADPISVPLLNEPKKNKKKKKKKGKKTQDVEVIISDNIGMPVEGTSSVSGGADESFEELLCQEDCTPSGQMEKRRKKKRNASDNGNENENDLSEKTSLELEDGQAPGADSISAPLLNEPKKKKKKKKKKKGKKRQDVEVISSDTISMPVEGPSSVSGDQNESLEPLGDTNSALVIKKKKKKKKKKGKRKKEQQETELTDPNSNGPDSVLQDLHENNEPVGKSKKKNKKKKQQEGEVIEQHNSNNSSEGAVSFLEELNDRIDVNGKSNKKKEKKEKKQKLEVGNADDSWASEGSGPLLPELNVEAEPISQSNNLVGKKRRRMNKQKTEDISYSAPNNGPTSVSDNTDIISVNTGGCSLTFSHQNGSLEGATACLENKQDLATLLPAALAIASEKVSAVCLEEKAGLTDCLENVNILASGYQNGASLENKQDPDCQVQAARAGPSIEASTTCSEEKAGLADCLENLRLRDQQEGTAAVVSMEGTSTLEAQDHKNDGVLQIAKQSTSQILVECCAATNYNQGASSCLPSDASLPEYPDHKIGSKDTDIREIDPPASKVVISKDNVMETIKMGEPQPILHTLLDPSNAHVSRKKLLILDLNGLLVDVVPYVNGRRKPDMLLSRKYVFKRPFVDGFLKFCFERFAVAIWSSRTKRNVDPLVKFLFGYSSEDLIFSWDQSHCTQTNFSTLENRDKPLVFKELRKVWEKLEPDLPWEKGEYNASNTLLLDDSPYKALCNPVHTAIFPYSYQHNMRHDDSLGPGGDLRVYLENLASAENIQEYVRQNPFGQRAISRSNGSWQFYEKVLLEVQPGRRIRQSRWDR